MQANPSPAACARSFGSGPQIANPSLNKAALKRRPPLERCVSLASVSGPTVKQVRGDKNSLVSVAPGGGGEGAAERSCDCYSV